MAHPARGPLRRGPRYRETVAGTDDEHRSEPAPGRHRWRRWILGALALWVLAVTVSVAVAAADAYAGLRDLRDVRASTTENLGTFVAAAGGGVDDTDEEDVSGRLTAGADRFDRAHRLLTSPAMVPLRLLPVLGRQLRSAGAITGTAAVATRAGATAVRALRAESDAPTSDPSQRLGSVERTAATLHRLQRQVKDLDLGPEHGLVGPLSSARNDAASNYQRLLSTLNDAVASVDAVNRFLTGPTRYLLLAANNAEMRNGSGMLLQVGTLDVAGGRVSTGDMTPTGDLLLPAPGVRVDPQVADLWGWLLPGREWRNLNVTSRFDESARMATDMWVAGGRRPVQGAVAVDVAGIEELLRVVGPVQVTDPGSGTTIDVTADSVEQLLLLDQYRSYSTPDARRDFLGAVAKGVFEALNARPASGLDLVQALQRAANGRHILMWSSEPVEQAGWEALGASGVLPEDTLMVSLLNRNGTKLDQFIGVRSTLSATDQGGRRRVKVRVDLRNVAPPDLPTYVAGPFPGTDYRPGEYAGILALTLPAGAGNITTDGEPGLVGSDGPTRIVTSWIRLQRDATASVTFEFDLLDSWTGLTMAPSARLPAVTWQTVGPLGPGPEWPDSERRTIEVAELTRR